MIEYGPCSKSDARRIVCYTPPTHSTNLHEHNKLLSVAGPYLVQKGIVQPFDQVSVLHVSAKKLALLNGLLAPLGNHIPTCTHTYGGGEGRGGRA